jgi:putative transposase
MQVMFNVTNPVEREHTMARSEGKSDVAEIKALLSANGDFLRAVVQSAVQAALEAEMTETLAAERSERVGERRGYRSGCYSRSLITRVGTIELRVPRDRSGLFSTELFERYQRSEKALVSGLAEMYVQGVSTRKVKAVTETLCGHSFSASAISGMNRTLDAALTAFATRRLDEPYPYLILDARYERVREAGVIASQAVLVAVAVDGEGRRQILGVELANRESTSSWRDFLLDLRQRGLHGVEFVVSDDHPGLKQAIREVLSEAAWQRCYVHFLRNALDYLPRRGNPAGSSPGAGDDCLQELRWIYDRRELVEVRRDLAAWLSKWSGKYARLCSWVEENIEETLTYYRLPLAHHKHMKSTNMLERLNQEIKRRTHVVRIFPNTQSCLRLVRALAVETHEDWLESPRYLNMEHLREHKKQQMRAAA